MKKFFKEFKDFAMRGNVIDMAVGVVVGTGFSKIVNSLVNDIFLPIVAALTSDVKFEDLSFILRKGEETNITLNYGVFIQSVINFVIVALCMFAVVKTMNKLNSLKNKPQEKVEEPKKSPELIELEKISKLLENRK